MSKLVSLRSSLAALVAISIGASTVAAQSGRTQAEKLDSLAGSGVLENRVVGTVAAVVKGNDTLLLKGYGKADVEWDVPMPTDAMFEIGSIAKQFTAVAILQLRDSGKLSLDDDITKWLPDFDTRGNKVPLRRLLDPSRGRDMVVEVTQTPQGLAFSANGTSGPVTELRFDAGSGYYILKRQ